MPDLAWTSLAYCILGLPVVQEDYYAGSAIGIHRVLAS